MIPGLTAVGVTARRTVVVSPNSELAGLEPHKYCWAPVGPTVTSFNASPQEEGDTNVAVAGKGRPTERVAVRGTVPEVVIV